MKLLFTFLLLSSVCLGQSKKDQIEGLNKSIDSLNTVLATTKDNSTKEIKSLNDKIKEVTDEVTALKSDLTNLQTSNNKLSKENEKFKTDLGELSKKNDKLKLDLEELDLEELSKENDILKLYLEELSMNFYNFPSGPIGSNKIVEINKNINKHAVGQLEWGMNKTGKRLQFEIAFASYYGIYLYGVGTGCSQGVMIDLRNGTVYSLPIECPACVEEPDVDIIDCRKNSLLFVNTYCPNQSWPDDGVRKNDKYLWSEKTKKFIKIN